MVLWGNFEILAFLPKKMPKCHVVFIVQAYEYLIRQVALIGIIINWEKLLCIRWYFDFTA